MAEGRDRPRRRPRLPAARCPDDLRPLRDLSRPAGAGLRLRLRRDDGCPRAAGGAGGWRGPGRPEHRRGPAARGRRGDCGCPGNRLVHNSPGNRLDRRCPGYARPRRLPPHREPPAPAFRRWCLRSCAGLPGDRTHPAGRAGVAPAGALAGAGPWREAAGLRAEPALAGGVPHDRAGRCSLAAGRASLALRGAARAAAPRGDRRPRNGRRLSRVGVLGAAGLVAGWGGAGAQLGAAG